MSDEFEILDDEEEQTLALDEDEIGLDDDEDGFAGDESGESDEGAEGEDDDFEEELPPPSYRAGSDVYALFLVLSCLLYMGAIAITLRELYDYCDKNLFLWGLMK